ncbi:hypothetical protein T4D_3718 [Trichinella pseudospiralis]|uniref:Uncharacterized protein n=1 Tax=Trichinella pseudospiralis TaxID=6337 RepID=A0A0V1F358_TRIPS|nr:hypothetical protein T4D_3718 [Trichinella pseudospiralis]
MLSPNSSYYEQIILQDSKVLEKNGRKYTVLTGA